MNCEVAHERIVLAAYGELADEQIHELDRHLTTCNECSTEREQLQALKTLAGAHSVQEPNANLVARSRMRLEEALDALPPKRWYERWGDGILNNFARLQTAPVAAALLLVAGLGAGSIGGYEVAQARAAHAAAGNAAEQACETGGTTAPATPGRRGEYLEHRAAAEQRDGRSALQRSGAAAGRGAARRSGDPAAADDGLGGCKLGGHPRRFGGPAGGRVPRGTQLQCGGHSRCAHGGAAL